MIKGELLQLKIDELIRAQTALALISEEHNNKSERRDNAEKDLIDYVLNNANKRRRK